MSDILKTLDPKLDLILERVVDVPIELVWKAWTEPEHLKQWFCPKPWQTTECEIDLRPGGLFRTKMQGPEGEEHAGDGCYLEVIKNERLVWTDALSVDYRPNSAGGGCMDCHFTGFVLMEPHENGTKYTAIAKHATEENCNQHKEMGFEDGWGTALEQLVEYAKSNLIN